MIKDFYSDDDLKDLLAEMDDENDNDTGEEAFEDEEMLASQRRYEEIVKKYKN